MKSKSLSAKMKTKRKFVPTSGVLALAGEALTFDGSGDIVFRSKGTLCGRGGKGDLEVVAMFGLSNRSARPNLREHSERTAKTDCFRR